MNITFIVFMTALSTVSLLATLAILYQMVKESGATKRARIEADRQLREAVLKALSKGHTIQEEPIEETVTNPVLITTQASVVPTVTEITAPVSVIPSPVVEEKIAPAPDPTPEPATTLEAENGKISFSASQQQTLDEQYRTLSKEQKRFYDKIAAYAASKEGSKCNKNQRYQEYKIGAKRIVRLRIKRGILHCEFLMINRDLRNHFSESKIPVKETATVIKVQNTETVQIVFSSIDLAIQLIEEERAYKKQLAKERRRQSKQQAKP